MTLQEKIRTLEVAWKDAQKEAENERNPEGIRETYDDMAQRYIVKLQALKEQLKRQTK